MNIIIIPGFTGHPEEITFKDLEKTLVAKKHTVIKISWPYFPEDLRKYSVSETVKYARKIVRKNTTDLVILGFSLGGVIATKLASEFDPKKLGLIVSPYQAGSEDDLAGKYKEWKRESFREVNSSRYGKLKIPFSFIEDAMQYNALDFIDKVKCPKLFIVGEKDDRVSIKLTRKLFEKAIEPKEWHKIPMMEHKYQYQPEILKKVNEIIVNFIDHS